MASYADFLKGKVKLAPVSGFEIADSDINPILKDHQPDMFVEASRNPEAKQADIFGSAV